MDFYDGSPAAPYRGVSGGFRAGKRKRGTSLLKRKPKQTVHTYSRDLLDSSGEIVATNIRTISYKRPQ
jgi:hypothetical protein